MKTGRGWVLGISWGLVAIAAWEGRSWAQQAIPPSATPEVRLVRALLANPSTAVSPITVTSRGGSLVIAGRVGTTRIHDQVIAEATRLGVPYVDNLIIDTNVAHQVAGFPTPTEISRAPLGLPPNAWMMPAWGSSVWTPSISPYGFDSPWVYDPPLVTFPPWWPEQSAYRREQDRRLAESLKPRTDPPAGPAAPQAESPASNTLELPPTVEMGVDPRGIAVLRGTVPTELDKAAIGQSVSQFPGIAGVLNLIKVQPPELAVAKLPPPPPAPRPPIDTRPVAIDQPVAPPALEGLEARVSRAIRAIPALADHPVNLTARQGEVTLQGKLPSVIEAMLAYRAVQKIPGVRSIVDRLEFPVPAQRENNPLVSHPAQREVLGYLDAQIRRQLGDSAYLDHLDREGRRLTLSVLAAEGPERQRAEAVLRSMPLLRGFEVETSFGLPSDSP